MHDTEDQEEVPMTTYRVTLRVSHQHAETEGDLAIRITSALKGIGYDPEALEVTEVPDTRPNQALIDAKIDPLSSLYLALPARFQRAEILDALAERYHYELTCLWRSARDPRCRRPVLRLMGWRRAGSQWICEFLSWDNSVPVRGVYNLHAQETSRWQNPDTGWHGHQGAIVFDEHDGSISAHH